MVACQTLLFWQDNNRHILNSLANVKHFFSLLILLFLTVPETSHVLISQGKTLKSKYFMSKICVHIRTRIHLEAMILKYKSFQCFFNTFPLKTVF